MELSAEMDQEIRVISHKIVERMKNQDLARTLAENLVNGQLVFLVQSDIDKINQGIGCHITLDDVYYARDLMLHQERRDLNDEIDRIAAHYQNDNRIPTESERIQLRDFYGRVRMIQDKLAEKYHNLSAFKEEL